MAPTRRWLALTAFVALIAGAGGVSAGILIASPPTPASLASSSALPTVPVTTREFTDTRSLTLTIPPASPHELTSPIAGRITALQAAPGTPITSGSIPCEIDGLPLLALALSTPLYQDVVDGATGPDIAALNGELARLGYAAPAESDRVTAATRAALASAMGVNDGAGGVPSRIEASHVLWIPAPTVTPSSVPVHLGDSVDTQTVLLALEDSRDALHLSVPPDAYPADHVITLGDTDYPVPSDGVITDPALTATILSSREYTDFVRSAPSSDGPVQLPVSWKLAAPITVTVIPPASVIGDATNACVFASGTPIPVSIVSSQLGRTYVLPTTPLSTVDTAVEGRSCPSS